MKFNPSRGASFDTFAYRVVQRAMRKAHRKGKRAPEVKRSSDAPSEASHAVQQRCTSLLVIAAVRDWIASLPAVFGQVFSALYEFGIPQREAAIALGMSQSQVSKLHRELLERARKQFAC